MAPFTFNPADFPPLTRANPAESNSAKTASFHANQPSETASSNSTNSISTPQHSDFCKFFLANSKPPSIGATEEINGRPTIIFSDSETQSLVANFRLALIGKFSQGTPPYSQLHRLLAKSGIKGAFTVSLINNKHALISLSNESDFTRLWLRRIWYLNGFPMRIFKWSPPSTRTMSRPSSQFGLACRNCQPTFFRRMHYSPLQITLERLSKLLIQPITSRTCRKHGCVLKLTSSSQHWRRLTFKFVE
ncbi:UNVERIFIED_CONTAM: hypothetical protein Sradi_6502400 [Sesamum radiatum]|uniref:DUF4283 domain-containing protein n=1 Tax=Sesamum radiatum TaxID=300843 RepID=A0AAW2JV47_SESRA